MYDRHHDAGVGHRRRMLRADVVVEGDGTAYDIRWTRRRVRVAVVRPDRVEDHSPVEARSDPLVALRHRTVPELELATPLRQPTAVEEDDDVDAALQVQVRLQWQIGVHLQESTCGCLVQSAVMTM